VKRMLLTEPEAAEALQVCARMLREARKAGELRYVLIGRSVRYTLEDLESYVDSRRQVSSPCPAQLPPPKRTTRKQGDAQIIPFHLRKRAVGGERL